MKQSIKAKRNIGLVALTVLVIVIIVLVVYFVQKADLENGIKRGGIHQTLSTAYGDICVLNMVSVDSIGDKVAQDSKCFIIVTLEIKAKKKVSLIPEKFSVDGGKQILLNVDGRDFLTQKAVLQKGESKSFDLLYEVKNDRMESYFLYGYGVKVDLGNTIRKAPRLMLQQNNYESLGKYAHCSVAVVRTNSHNFAIA